MACAEITSGLSSNRYSMVSTSETYNSGLGTNESNPLFRQSQSFASMSQHAFPSPDAKVDPASMSQLALPAARGVPIIGRDPSRGSVESGISQIRLERGLSDDPSSFSHSSNAYSPYRPYSNESYNDEAEQPILPPNFPFSSATSSPELSHPQPGQYGTAMHVEPEPVNAPRVQAPPRSRQATSHGRGISLVDTGPVPVGGQAPHDPVRRVSRHARRSSSRNQLVSPVSSSSHASHLPPGAVKKPVSPVAIMLIGPVRRLRHIETYHDNRTGQWTFRSDA